jgi:hypothetical protein
MFTDDFESPTGSKAKDVLKTKTPMRPSAPSHGSVPVPAISLIFIHQVAASSGNGKNAFLTAAEQRVADKKAKKQEKEETYEFLKDDVIMDVRS